MKPQALFVYGTLRPDVSTLLLRWGLDMAKDICTPASVRGLQMHDLGTHPAAVRTGCHSCTAHGYYVEITDPMRWKQMLYSADTYEGSGFQREVVAVLTDARTVQVAWTYLYATPSHLSKYPIIPSGAWTDSD